MREGDSPWPDGRETGRQEAGVGEGVRRAWWGKGGAREGGGAKAGAGGGAPPDTLAEGT